MTSATLCRGEGKLRFDENEYSYEFQIYPLDSGSRCDIFIYMYFDHLAIVGSFGPLVPGGLGVPRALRLQVDHLTVPTTFPEFFWT